jgi:hypothetical protein
VVPLPVPVFGGLRPLPAAPPVLVGVAAAGCVAGTEVPVGTSVAVGVLVKFEAVCVALAAAVLVPTTTAVWVANVSAVAVVFAAAVCSALVGVFVAVAVSVGVGVSALTDVVPKPTTAPASMSPAAIVAAPAITSPVFRRSDEPGRVVLVCKLASILMIPPALDAFDR